MYENIELVNPNGQPTAKVVVGSQAQISDGIAAANIAAVLANKAYKSSTLSAQVTGTATCSASGQTAGGSGTCEVTDKKALIEIIVPGQMANAYQFKTLITDTIDRTLQNRVSSNSEDVFSSANSNDVGSTTILSPLRFTTLSSDKKEKLFLIDGSKFMPFKDKTVVDKQSSGFSYVVKQRFWVGSSSNGVRFDESSDEVIAEPRVVAYSLFFDGNDYGIPVCTKADESGNGNWAWCSTSSQYATANHRLEIPFMGANWVISSITPPEASIFVSSTNATKGGTIKLAKEAKYDIINVGGVIDAGDFKIRLADISVATGSTNEHPAIIDILDSSDAVIGQIKVNEGETYTFTQSSTGKQINVHVYRTAPGFTMSAKWAEIAIYSDEIILQDGKAYNLASSNDKNKNFIVSLIWKNRDYSGGNSNDQKRADSLREIVIYNADDFTAKKYKPGETFNFLADPSVFKLTYNGLDLTDADRIPVNIEVTQTTLSLSSNNNDCSGLIEYTGTFVRFSTSGDYFGSGSGTDLLETDKVSSFYFDPVGTIEANDGTETTISDRFDGNSDGKGTQDFTGASDGTNTAGRLQPAIIYQKPGFSCYFVKDITVNTALTELVNPSNGNTIRFDYAGSDSGAYGLFFFTTDDEDLMPPSGGNPDNDLTGIPAISSTDWLKGLAIAYQEDAGKYDTISHYPVTLYVPFYKTSTTTFKLEPSGSTQDRIYYAGVDQKGSTITGAITSWSTFEPTFISERGSVVGNYDSLSYTIHVAKQVGMPTFTFSFADTALAESGEVWEASEGDTKTLDNGVKLKLKEIRENVGTCKVAGGSTPTCTVDMTPVSAKIMPDNVVSVQAVQPYDIRGSNLVISDREAAGVGGVQILVGGPVVNSATADALKDSAVDFDVNTVYVKAIGNKIVVAGKTAADTMQAAKEFIDKLTVN
jgi:hypothetical protein